MKSLRTRLFAGMTAIIVLTGCLGATFAYFWAYSEAIEMQDSVLSQIGSFARKGSFKSGQTIHGVDTESEITVLEFPDSNCEPLDECHLAELGDGLHLSSYKGAPVRVFVSTRTDGSRFAVAQGTDIRDELAGEMALRTLLPIAVIIPCLMLVTAIVIARTLRPMVHLAHDLDTRRADDLTTLPINGTPKELDPFIVSINRLFDRLTVMVQQQRRFVADAAHELRTPLTALIVQAENLSSINLPPEARSRLHALKEGMLRTKHLLEQLLSLARQDAIQIENAVETRLDNVAKAVAADLMPMASQKGLDLGFTRIEPITVRGDAIVVGTLVRNLLDNAIRFTPNGGRVDIGVYGSQRSAVLQIKDTGLGIPASDMTRIFEPFDRGSRPSGDGTGLGLAIVKRIVDRLGGSITIANRSEPEGTGLSITVVLPAIGTMVATTSTPNSGAVAAAHEVVAPETTHSV